MYSIYPSHPGYSTDLRLSQRMLIRINLNGALSRLRKYRPEDIIEAIAYVVKTGCQWQMLPDNFPEWKTVYHHFRSLSERGWFQNFLKIPVEGRRASLGLPPETTECVIDSRSVRSSLPQTQKGVDGNKKIKGIKRHIAVDCNGYDGAGRYLMPNMETVRPLRRKLPLSGVFSVNFAKSHRSCSSLHSLFNLRNSLENTTPLH